MLWPTPYPMTTTLEFGGEDASRLVLPTRAGLGGLDSAFSIFASRSVLCRSTSTRAGPGRARFEVTRDEAHRTARVHWHGTASARFPWGVEEYSEELFYAASDEHPELSSVHGVAFTKISLQGRMILFQSVLDLSSDAKTLKYQYQRVARENGKIVREERVEGAGGAGSAVTLPLRRGRLARSKNSAILLISCPDQKGSERGHCGIYFSQ